MDHNTVLTDISRQFDEYGMKEWERLTATPVDEISLYLHTHYLQKYIRPGWRVLEIGAGAGRFTQVLAELGARIAVADISQEQITLNQRSHSLVLRKPWIPAGDGHL